MSLLSLPELAVVRRLLRANLRHTEIARRLGMPVETVTLVATSRKLCRRRLDLLTEEDLPDDYDAPPDYLAANLRRCEGCGGIVYRWPCLACRLRDAQAAGLVLPDEEEEDEDDADCIAATSGRGDAEGHVGEGASSHIASLRAEYQVLSTQYQVASNAFSRSPPLPLSPSFTSTEPSHAHA